MDFGGILGANFDDFGNQNGIKNALKNRSNFWIAPGTAQGCQKAPKCRDQLRSRNFAWPGRGGREGEGGG